MKRALLLSFVLIGVFVFGDDARAQTNAETILHFDVVAAIQADASVHIQETIVYDFGINQKHGIFRYIPVSYKTSAGNKTISINTISVSDENSTPYQFTHSQSGSKVQIKIGDPSVLISGVKTYVISYTVLRAIGYFDTYDEFYWNATGTGWLVPILEASTLVILPAATWSAFLRSSCYEGAAGSTHPCHIYGVSKIDGTNDTLTFSTDGPLSSSEGLTVAFGFPHGLVAQPTRLQNLIQIVKDNGILILPIIIFLIMLWLWYTRGRDPRGRGTIVPLYDAPDSLAPLELYAVLYERVSNASISSEIIYLATKGYIKITKLHEKILVFTHTDYRLDKLKGGNDLPVFNKAVLDGIFGYELGNKALGVLGKSVKLSELHNTFYKNLPTIKSTTIASVVSKKYFPVDPNTVRGRYILLGMLIIAFGLGLTFGLSWGIVYLISFTLSGLIVLVFSLIMPKVTKEGAILREQIKGLKMYMEVAEKDRINFHNAPEKSPEIFEKLLPFAMILGVEKAWAKQFEGIYDQSPSWYSDPLHNGFSPVLFASDIRSFSTGAASTLASAPNGGSGTGGGGFSGGGFGGGGGGSW